MPYGTKYVAQWTSPEGQLVNLYLDKKDYDGASVSVKPGAQAAVLTWDSNDKNKLQPIRTSYLDIQVIAEGQLQIAEFLTVDPTAWRVRLQYNGAFVWHGFIASDDVQEPLQDPPYVLQMRAIDGLGLLQDIPFIEESAAACFSLNRVSFNTTINKCIRPINDLLGLDVRVWVNIFGNEMTKRDTDPAANPLWQSNLFWESFRDSESSYMSCYEVLEAICTAWGATLLQSWGRWHIQRVTERIGKPGASDTWYTDYRPTGIDDALGPLQVVGSGLKGYEHRVLVDDGNFRPNNNSCWAAVDQILFNQRAAGGFRVKYDFEVYENMPSNRNWDRITPLGVGLEYDPSIDTTPGIVYKFYRPDCWYLVTLSTNVGIPIPNRKLIETPSNAPWYLIRETDDYDSEYGRYIGILDTAGGAERVTCTVILINKDDRFTLSGERRETNEGGQSGNIATYAIYLEANDGTVWSYDENTKKFENNATFVNGVSYTSSESKQQWRSFGSEPAVIPRDGVVKIYLFNANLVPGASVQFRDIDIQVEVYTGANTKPSYLLSSVTTDANSKVLAEADTTITETVKDALKGNIYRATSNLQRFSGWKRYGVTDTSKKFHEQLLLALVQTKRFTFRYVTGTVYGVKTNTGEGELPLSPLNIFTAQNIPTAYFMVDNMSVDFSNDTAVVTLLELWNTVVGTGADFDVTPETKLLTK